MGKQKAEATIIGARQDSDIEVQPVEQNVGPSYITRNFTMPPALYEQITSYTAYNKLRKSGPDSTSAVVRQAVELYFKVVPDEGFWKMLETIG